MGTRQNVPQLLERIADLERAVAVLAYLCKDLPPVNFFQLTKGLRIEVVLADKIVIVETKS